MAAPRAQQSGSPQQPGRVRRGAGRARAPAAGGNRLLSPRGRARASRRRDRPGPAGRSREFRPGRLAPSSRHVTRPPRRAGACPPLPGGGPGRAVRVSLAERAGSGRGGDMFGNGLSYSEQGGEAAPELVQEAAPTTTPSAPAAFGLFSSDTKK